MRLGAISWSAALVCVALLLAGCGHAVHARRGGVVRVAVMEYRLRPDDIIARAGTITLVARNLGRLSHNLAVTATGANARILAATRPIPPGASRTLVVTLRPGRYGLASMIQSDESLGDRGTLTITR